MGLGDFGGNSGPIASLIAKKGLDSPDLARLTRQFDVTEGTS